MTLQHLPALLAAALIAGVLLLGGRSSRTSLAEAGGASSDLGLPPADHIAQPAADDSLAVPLEHVGPFPNEEAAGRGVVRVINNR